MKKNPFFIVFGNTKGGVGKSTLAMHTAIYLAYEQGLRVACVDLDGGQGTLSRGLENRARYNAAHSLQLPVPNCLRLSYTHENQDLSLFKEQLAAYLEEHDMDVVVVDTPGSDTPLSRYGHSLSDVLVSPINDSSVDLDLFVNVGDDETKSGGNTNLPLGTYANMVWEQRLIRAADAQDEPHKKRALEWIVLKNRVHTFVSRNQLYIEKILDQLSKRIGFHVMPGVAERVIFRELFPYGLTLLDRLEKQTTLSHVTARQEIKGLAQFLLQLMKKHNNLYGK